MKIRTKYQLTTALLIIAATGSAAAMVIHTQGKDLRSRATQRLGVLLEGAAHTARQALASHDRLMMVDYLMLLQKEHPELAFASVTRGGHVVKLGGESGGLMYLESSVFPAGKPVRYTVAAYPSPSGAATGQLNVSTGGVTLSVAGKATVNVETPAAGRGISLRLGFIKAFVDREVQSALDPLIRWTAGIAGGFTLLGLFLNAWLSKLLTGPAEALTRATVMLAAGRMEVSVPVPADDEMGALAGSFNSMAGRLKDLAESREEAFNKAASRGGVQPVKVEEIFGEAVAMFAPMARAKGLNVFPLHRINTGRITAREELLRPIVVNLISNAIKYTPAGGEVRMDLSDSPAELMFYVSNTGPGIPAGDLPRMFTGPSGVDRASGGGTMATGPGLSIVHKAVTALGGRIAVESRAGEITLFLVKLPKSGR